MPPTRPAWIAERRHVNEAQQGGAARLLVALARAGLSPDALPAAAALATVMDADALERADERRRRSQRANRVRWDGARAA